MRVSRNEMIAALRRAYEGAGYDIGDYEDAAELVTWSEMCGLGGFADIALPPVGPKGAATPRLIYEGIGVAVIEAGGADVCEYGSLAAHLAYAKAVREGFATVQLANCTYPGLILRCMSLVAQRAVYLAAYWRDAAGAHGASFDRGAIFPSYWCVSSDESVNLLGPSTITIMCTGEPALLADAVVRQVEQPDLARRELTAVQLGANYDSALENGIDVDPAKWDALNAAAWPILVRSTEQSRAGAGPG